MDNGNLPIVVGKREILRFMKENEVEHIQIATDADRDYIESIVTVAKSHNVHVEFKGTKDEIARTHNIQVPSAAVGFLKIRNSH